MTHQKNHAEAILKAYQTFRTRFDHITRNAKTRFINRDWKAVQAAAAERISLYRGAVDGSVEEISALIGEKKGDKTLWGEIRTAYSSLISDRCDWEIAETFYNSVTRRIFSTVGVDEEIEFVATDFEAPPTKPSEQIYQTFPADRGMEKLIREILRASELSDAFEDLDTEARLVGERIESVLSRQGLLLQVERAEIIRKVFYRSMGAYIVGRLIAKDKKIPLALALLHPKEGVRVDAVLLDEDSASILFSYTRSAFHIDVNRPYDLVRFIKSMIPHKPLGELYSSIGYHKHGKTELFRDIRRHLTDCRKEQFRIARGKQGMVMLVFDITDFDLVFKLIRDRFARPKSTTKAEVMEKYDLVFRHDRAGRLVEAQSFEHLQFEMRCFSPDLLRELEVHAKGIIRHKDSFLVVDHAYVERRVTPLDIFIQEANPDAAEKAVIDYGQSIKDLARSNIFCGDLLIKNFGVTRHKRVVFYDYDELALITECRFRKIPPSRSYEDEMAAEPWFKVGPDDVFPEEFSRFLGLPDRLQQVFMDHHAELLDSGFWKGVQERILAGEPIHIFPYSENDMISRS